MPVGPTVSGMENIPDPFAGLPGPNGQRPLGPHPRPDLLDAAVNRRLVRLADGRTGRVQWVNSVGSRVKVLADGRHLVVPADGVTLEREP